MRTPKPRRVTVTRYVDPKTGQRVPKGTWGARRLKSKSDTYYVTIAGQRSSLGTTDEAEAWIELRKRLQSQGDYRSGVRNEYTDQAARPFAEHLQEWLDSLRAEESTEKHIRQCRGNVQRLVAEARWRNITDIGLSSCLTALAALQKRHRFSAQTRNHYAGNVKQFARWLWNNRRLREYPLALLKPVSVETDRRHDRRCPSDEEIATLFAHLAKNPPILRQARTCIRRGMSGPQRALCYKVAMATGFRAAEMRSLTRESFDLDAGTATVRACYSKRRRRDVQHLPGWLVTELREWFGRGGGTWERLCRHRPGQALKEDLASAGIPYVTPGPDGPLYFDFHALRHWYCTQIANQPNITPKTLMALTRHSTAQLALKIYAKVRVHELRTAAELIPNPVLAPSPVRKKSHG